MVAKDANVQNLLVSPNVSALCMVDFFSDIVGVNDIDMKEFLVILSKNKRLDVLPDIADLFAEMMAEKAGVVTVEVISSDTLDEAPRVKLQKSAEKRFSAKIEMKYSLDKSLIGGAVIRSGNWVMDGSIKGKLARMRESLG
jgi:F-type H+-transporting ATPase subunit delta